MAVRDPASWGFVGQGTARYGMAIVADGSTELRKKFPAALYGEQTRHGLDRQATDGRRRAG
jgi:hypothetical protein